MLGHIWECIFPLHNNKEHLSMFTYRTHSPLILCHDFIYRDLDHFTIQEASLSGVALIYHDKSLSKTDIPVGQEQATTYDLCVVWGTMAWVHGVETAGGPPTSPLAVR